jgi:hypothetical protein
LEPPRSPPPSTSANEATAARLRVKLEQEQHLPEAVVWEHFWVSLSFLFAFVISPAAPGRSCCTVLRVFVGVNPIVVEAASIQPITEQAVLRDDDECTAPPPAQW